MSNAWWCERLTSPILPGGRAELVAGIMGLPWGPDLETWIGCHKGWEEKAWNLGMITGESGTGKTTLAKAIWPQAITADSLQWPPGTPVVDLFPATVSPTRLITLLTAAGLSSPPAWLRPVSALSTGQRFRVLLARLIALASPGDTVVVDEFATGVDSETARATSVGISRLVRANHLRLVAMTSRSSLADWLNPDWLAQPSFSVAPFPTPVPNTFQWRLLRPRPTLTLQLARCPRTAWTLFRSHHYLNGSLSPSATCLGAWLTQVGNRPVPPRLIGFTAWMQALGKPGVREHRTVVLPPWQGMGVGSALSAWAASLFKGLGQKVWSTTGHPAVIQSRRHSTQWRLVRPPGLVNPEKGRLHATRRLTAGFQYQGPAMSPPLARAILGRTKNPRSRTRT